MDFRNSVVHSFDRSGQKGNYNGVVDGARVARQAVLGREFGKEIGSINHSFERTGYFSPNRAVSWVNRISNGVLDGLAYVGKKYNELPRVISPIAKEAIGLDTNIATNHVNVTDDLFVDDLAEVFDQKLGKPGFITKGLAKLGGFVDGATGVLSTLGTFAKERELGNDSYSETMKEAFNSVGQISAGAVAATIASGVVVGMGATFSAPVLVVGGVAWLGGSYLFRKMIDVIN